MENKQTNICGYCGRDLTGEAPGTLTLSDKEGTIIEEINICNGCTKRLQVKIALTRMPKEDVESLADFLSRGKKIK